MPNVHEIIKRNKHERLLTPEQQWQSLQTAFLTLRDVPYGIYQPTDRPLTLDGHLNNFLAQGTGTCTPKHLLLGLMCEKFGINVEYLSYYFYWQNLKINYPEELRAPLSKMPAQLHTSIAISLLNDTDNKNYEIDCTWDRLLQNIGFPINFLNESPSGCALGVIPHSAPIIHRTAEDKWLFLQRTKSMMPLNPYTSLFYKGLNEWMLATRSQPTFCDQQDNSNSPIADRLSLIAIAQFENS